MNYYVMLTTEDGCPSLLHDPVIGKKREILFCCCPAYAYRFSYSDACFVAQVLKGEVVTAEAYDAKLIAWNDSYPITSDYQQQYNTTDI